MRRFPWTGIAVDIERPLAEDETRAGRDLVDERGRRSADECRKIVTGTLFAGFIAFVAGRFRGATLALALAIVALGTAVAFVPLVDAELHRPLIIPLCAQRGLEPLEIIAGTAAKDEEARRFEVRLLGGL